MRWDLVLTATVCWSLLAACAQSAVVSVFPRLGGAFNSDFTPVDASMIVSSGDDHIKLLPRDEKYVLQIDFLMTLTDLTPQQYRFASSRFDLNLLGAVSMNSDVPGWAADPTMLDTNGTLPGGLGPKWQTICDCGDSGADLLGIYIANYPPLPFDLGVAPYSNFDFPHDDGEYAGSLYIEVAGDNPNGVVRVSGVSSMVFGVDGNPTAIDVENLGGRFVIGVPEPSTLALLSVAAASALFMRRERRERP